MTLIARHWISLFLLPFVCLLAACASGEKEADDGRYDPKVSKQGNLPLLYHANEEQVLRLFPIGTPRNAVIERFGSPAAGSAGKDVYSYEITYQKLGADRTAVRIARSVTAELSYDAADKLKAVEPLVLEGYVRSEKDKKVEERKPTHEEIAIHLSGLNPGSVNEAIAKGYPGVTPAAATAGRGPAGSTSAAATGSVWRTGLQVMEFQTNSGRTEVRVTDFDDGSVAKARGVRAKDTIVSVNGTKTGNTAEYSKAIRAATTDKPLVLRLTRAGKPVTVTLPVGGK
ncbi:MAG: PDZ domain-containing protein [Rhodocyclaceae bacterium]